MSVSATTNITQLFQQAIHGAQASTFKSDGTSGVQPSGPLQGPPPTGGGGLIQSVMQALSSLGVSVAGADATDPVSSRSDTSSPDATQSQQQALGAFIHSLMEALHAQSAGSTDTGGDAAGDGSVSSPSGARSRLSSDLQSLIEKLTSNVSSANSASGVSSSSGTTASDSALSNLNASFKNLLATLGSDGSDATLSGFLSAFSKDLSPFSTSGNVVNTNA